MPQNLYEAIWLFVIYSFIGWCVEVIFVGLNKGHFVNRGFLNGPYCPVYGCGMLVVVVLLTPLKDNTLMLFIGSVVLTTVLEYLTGLVLEKVFSNKWWDYSDVPFNIQGYVCLKFSILWGLGCVFIMNTVHPIIYKVICFIPKTAGIIVLAVLLLVLMADACVTINTILKFNQRLKQLEKLATAIHRISDEISEDIYEKASAVAEKSLELQTEWKEKISERDALKDEYRMLLEKRHFGFRRLTKAFPEMKSRKWNETLQQYKKFVETKKKR